MNKRPASDLSTILGETSQVLPPRKRNARQRERNPPAPPPPLYRASVDEVADASAVAIGSTAAEAADNGIIERIKKCLARAHHPSTPEAEAKAAVHLASRLMGQYNVSQAEVLAHEDASVRQQYAGQSVVSLRHTDGDKRKGVRHQTYVNDLCSAMECFFNCKYYTTAELFHMTVTFYGIGENTTAAAMSFEMVYNLVNEWARAYKGGNPRNSYLLGISSSLKSMALIEKAEEEDRARRAEADAIAAREREEEAEQQARLDRLAPLRESPSAEHQQLEIDANAGVSNVAESSHSATRPPDDESYLSESESFRGFDCDDDHNSLDEESGSEDFVETDFKVEPGDRVNPFIDVDDEVQRLVKVEPEVSEGSSRLWSASLAGLGPHEEISSLGRSPATTLSAETKGTAIRTEEQELDKELKWTSHMQLVTFRETAANIADDFLKKKGTKLTQRSANYGCIRDVNAYRQGKADSRKIDVRRRRITE